MVMMELQPISISCDERAGGKCLIDMMEYTYISENPQILVNWFTRVGITWGLDGMQKPSEVEIEAKSDAQVNNDFEDEESEIFNHLSFINN